MKTIQIKSDPVVQEVFEKYPDAVRPKMMQLRQLILDTAAEVEEVRELEETLKWGEPSYLTKKGSTIRIDWKERSPGQYAMYFKCTSKLVPSFRHAFADVFRFEGNRAIVFDLADNLPEAELKACVAKGLTYHRVKHLPWLGL